MDDAREPVDEIVRIAAFGTTAVLVEVADGAAALSLAAWCRAGGIEANDVVAGERSVLLDGLDAAGDGAGLDRWRHRLAGWSPTIPDPDADTVEITVDYQGPDLDDVARAWHTDRAGVVQRHTALEFTVAFCGFAPGFAYLRGLPGQLQVPRLDSPRSRVPAGSVALAGPWCGVYPTASPGGWRVIGRTDATLWDAARTRPALLTPGTQVRFRAA